MINISDVLLVLFLMALGAIATLVWQWQLAPKEFKEIMKAIRTPKKPA